MVYGRTALPGRNTVMSAGTCLSVSHDLSYPIRVTAHTGGGTTDVATFRFDVYMLSLYCSDHSVWKRTAGAAGGRTSYISRYTEA